MAGFSSGSYARVARLARFAVIGLSLVLSASCANTPEDVVVAPPAAVELSELCSPAQVQAVASQVTFARVTVQQNAIEPRFAGGVRFVAAAGDAPAYCQVSGSFVTNPETGKTAGFLAAFPANWNGKYLQLGCSGHCGTFAVSDITTPFVTITSQGRPGDALRRGYAAFATDEGHAGMGGGAWAINAQGEVDRDAVEDYLYRAQLTLSHVGKEFTRAFYRRASGRPQNISHSYFSGCSGGGRDALVAASYFPEQFDGIIAGSPYANNVAVAYQSIGLELASGRSGAALAPSQIAIVDRVSRQQCDDVDGTHDNLIQNPAACDFRPERDLPRCQSESGSDQCFTPAQIETVSAYLTAVTDENGAVIQPGYSVSDFMGATLANSAAPGDSLPDATLRIFAHQNDASYNPRALVSLRDGGAGALTTYRAIVPRAEFDRDVEALRQGIGAIPENADRLIRGRTKLLIWSNLSDQLLTPYMATNYYSELAARYGGYANLQRHVRLFGVPNSIHCSMGGTGPDNFDALGAMENWVERHEAPQALVATLYQRNPAPFAGLQITDYNTPLRTMPLCAFPAMARYRGEGDVNAAQNWTCPANDQRMLTLGESGRRAGVLAQR